MHIESSRRTTYDAWRGHSRQRGAATLIVVMVLFFVMSLVAAYSSRNILFEQRTSSNLQVANVVQETAEAAMEWVLSQVNGSNITSFCLANPDPAAPTPSFRQRYLSTDADGKISGSVLYPLGGTSPVATCGFDVATQAWVCNCPQDGTVPATPTHSPAFGVRFVVPAAAKPRTIRAEVVACAQSSVDCLTFNAPDPSFCRGTLCALLALQSGLKSPPTAALTARGAVNALGTATLKVLNIRPDASGLTVVAGGAVNLGAAPTEMELRGLPGSPISRSYVQNDALLGQSLPATAAFTPDRMFAAFFGVWPTTYVNHPGAVAVACGGGCNADAVRDAIAVNPLRIILLQGDVALDGGADIGSATDPVVLVVQGNLTFAAPTNVYGFVYVQQADWVTAGSGQIIGGAAAQGAISGNGSFTVAHDPDVLKLLRDRTGTLVKVPGSWVDFQP